MRPRQVPIAIVGVAAMMPGSSSVAGFWRDVVTGRDLITDVPESHWLLSDYYDADPAAEDKTYGRRGAFLSPVDFPPLAYGVPPNTMPATDTTQLLALMVAEQVLADATGTDMSTLDKERTSVILGTGALELLYSMSNRLQRPIWLKSLRRHGIAEDDAAAICDTIAGNYVPWQEATFPGLLSNVVAGRIANRFDLHGTNHTTDAACASSLAAISSAVNELALGYSDLAVTGGVDTLNDIVMYMCFSKTPALSPTGDCRPFSSSADGTILGEGLVMLALKRLADAERDGERVYAVLRGIGSSSDGRAKAIYAPVPEGQSRAVRRAYDNAGYGPDTVELVEAHGTGTTAGDAAEYAGLRAVFAESGRDDEHWCALGSLKSQFGHTKSAAGAAGLVKAALALHHKVLPPTIKVDQPNPALGVDSGPLYLNTAARPWVRDDAHPRRASVSSFGFGGSNFHATLEEYVPNGSDDTAARPAWRLRTSPSELVLLSAESVDAVLAAASSLLATDDLTALARGSQASFRHDDEHRLAITATGLDDLAAKVGELTTLLRRDPSLRAAEAPGVHYATGAPDPGRIGFLFPGQGSQYVGMGSDLAMHHPVAQAVWDHVAGDLPLHRVVFPVPGFTEADRAAAAAALNATEWAQPALAAQSLALLAVLGQLGLRPDHVAGHSFGELVALHAAGSLDADTLVRLARRRGELMRDAASIPGAMLAIRASRPAVEQILAEFGSDKIWLANHNGPRQVVVSGDTDALSALRERLEADQIVSTALSASTAFHSPLVAPASTPLRDFLSRVPVASPAIPVHGNADGAPYPADPDSVRERIAEHLSAPVQFLDGIEVMYAAGVRTFVEVGAGSTLTGLVGEILGARPHLAVRMDVKGHNGATAAHDAFGRLAVAGIPLDFAALWEPYGPLPETVTTPETMTVPIHGANYGKPVVPNDLVEPKAPTPATGALRPEVMLELQRHALDAHREYQTQATEAHAEYQRLLAESHRTFLAVAESSLLGTGDVSPERTPAPVVIPAVAEIPLPPKPVKEIAAPAPPEAADDLTSVLLSIVADKTGYPTEMLNTSMELEADLGIDSIKRVEILSALQTQVPDLPTIDTGQLGALRTLNHIITALDGHVSAGPSIVDKPVARDLTSLLLSIVADKTGYPTEMLNTSMELEADLGIDSIKRVEILSALQTQVPDLPTIDTGQLGTLRTLDHIVTALDRHASSVDTTAAQPLTRLTIHTVAVDAPGLALAGLYDGPVVVTYDGTGLADHVAALLAEHDVEASVVTEIPPDANRVVHLSGSDDDTHQGMLAVARTVARQAPEGRLLVVVQDTGGDFGLSGGAGDRAWHGGVAGLARTAAREWPGAAVKTIDCAREGRADKAVAAAIVQELVTGGDTIDVGLHADGTRLCVVAAPAPVGPSDPDAVTSESVVVATGGGRGITAASLIALAEARRPRIVLFGRTRLDPEPPELRAAQDEAALRRALIVQSAVDGQPTSPAAIESSLAQIMAVREVRATIDALEAAGSPTRYHAVDIRDAEAVGDVLDAVRAEWGPVTAMVHGAGVIADRSIADKTDDEVARVMGTKVLGLRTLLAATRDDPLSLLCVFSSVSARFGNVGQSDYAMANEVLNQVAATEQAARPGCLVRSIGWGPWRGGMVDTRLAGLFRERGVPLIQPEDGARAFVDEVTSRAETTGVLLVADGGVDAFAATPRPGAQVRVNARSHPHLADHAIAGTPVLPLVMALEWLAAATGADRLRDVGVLRKVGLDGLANGGHLLTVRRDGDHVRLYDDSGKPCYQATVDGSAAPLPWQTPDDLSPVDDDVYDGHLLFHGPSFQAIRRGAGVSAAGAVGTLASARDLGWPDGCTRTDPAAADGALQLAVLWARQAIGKATLPMSVAEFRVHLAPPDAGGLTGVVGAGATTPGSATCDVAVLDRSGRPVVELLGVTLVARPS